MTRSLIVVAIGAVGLFVLELLAESNAPAFTNIPWALSLAVLGVILVILGGVAYRFLVGGVATKFALIALLVVIANGAAEIVVGSDQAYPRLGLWLIIPYVIACWFGAVVAIALAKLRSTRTGKRDQ